MPYSCSATIANDNIMKVLYDIYARIVSILIPYSFSLLLSFIFEWTPKEP